MKRPQRVDTIKAARTIEPDDYAAMIQRMIKALGKRVGQDDADALGLFDELRTAIDTAEYHAMDAMVESGFSFRHMARETGLTHSAIHNRFTRAQARFGARA